MNRLQLAPAQWPRDSLAADLLPVRARLDGHVLAADLRKYAGEYAPVDWDVRMKRASTVIDFHEHGLKARDLMLGIQAFGASRAFLYDQVIREKLVKDRMGGQPVLLVVGSDGESVRAFRD